MTASQLVDLLSEQPDLPVVMICDHGRWAEEVHSVTEMYMNGESDVISEEDCKEWELSPEEIKALDRVLVLM